MHSRVRRSTLFSSAHIQRACCCCCFLLSTSSSSVALNNIALVRRLLLLPFLHRHRRRECLLCVQSTPSLFLFLPPSSPSLLRRGNKGKSEQAGNVGEHRHILSFFLFLAKVEHCCCCSTRHCALSSWELKLKLSRRRRKARAKRHKS